MDETIHDALRMTAIYCSKCHMKAPYRIEKDEKFGMAIVCERCGHRTDGNFTRKFFTIPAGTLPVRGETPA